ncbi:MAG: ComEC/Rec2 family competence protein [bacterium]|nr:ComEC/Rec2 family competence protein [bacterium]
MKAVFCGVILSSFVLGVFFAPYFSVSTAALVALFAIFFLLSLSLIPEKWLWLSMIAIGFFFLGVFRLQQYQTGLEKVTYPTDKDVNVQGQVVEPPEDTKKATKVVIQDQDKKAKILLILRPFSGIKYGDYLAVEGKMVRPESESLKNNLLTKGISYQMLFPNIEKIKTAGNLSLQMQAKNLLYGVRNRFESSINSILPEPESSFLAGLLLGIKRNLPDWLMEDLQKSGTTHIIALSGFNITVIVMGLRLMFSKKSAKMSFYLPLIAIAGFVVMTGAQSSVVRAGIMGAMMMLAYRVGRQSSATMAIVITAAAMIFYNPMILRFDVGFQLSFAAFLGIIYLGPIIREILPGKRESLKEVLAMTLGAQVMAYPIILYYFGNFSLIALATNLIILPFIPFVMLIGFISTVLGMIWSYLGYVLSWTVFFALRVIIGAIHFSASLPFASLDGINISPTNMAICYIIVLELIFIYKAIKRKRLSNGR